MSLKRTCRKLGVSFWQYLTDRISHTYAIPPLPGLIQQRAASILRAAINKTFPSLQRRKDVENIEVAQKKHSQKVSSFPACSITTERPALLRSYHDML
jgi:hypothetical protein